MQRSCPAILHATGSCSHILHFCVQLNAAVTGCGLHATAFNSCNLWHCMQQDESITFCGPVTSQGPDYLVKQDNHTKNILQYAERQKITEIPEDLANVEANEIDVRTAYGQLVTNMQHVLERVLKDPNNQELYAELRHNTNTAVSLWSTTLTSLLTLKAT